MAQQRGTAAPGRGTARREVAPAARGPRLRVNPITCAAHGVCAELLPELITVDPWGYPIIADRPVPAGLHKLARKAAASCPTLALLYDQPDGT
jgi:ferredoxin